MDWRERDGLERDGWIGEKGMDLNERNSFERESNGLEREKD